jgi:hypothetical protein
MKGYLPVSGGEVPTQDHSRPVFVPDDLSALRGPVAGTVVLPAVLDWTPLNRYEMNDESDRLRLIETVLSEALSEDDVASFVDQETMARSWGRLRLPKRVRHVWESVHPRLASK